MEKRHIPVTYVVFPDEGHGFARPVNRLAFYAVADAFLAEHLDGRYQPIDGARRIRRSPCPPGQIRCPGWRHPWRKRRWPAREVKPTG